MNILKKAVNLQVDNLVDHLLMIKKSNLKLKPI